MTLCVFCTGVGTIYARYKHVELLREDATNVSACLNKAALWLGVISCFGMCIVATFQVCTHIKITFNTSQLIQCNYKCSFLFYWLQETVLESVHLTGAGLFFFCGIVYIILQSFISFRAYPYGSSRNVCFVRVAIASLAAVAFIPSILYERSNVCVI